MATSGTGAIITEEEAYKYGHIYLSSSSNKALTYGKMVDNADIYNNTTVDTAGYFAGAWITDDMRSTSSNTSSSINRYKCIKYSDLYNKSIKVPWHVQITEKVTGDTRANKIELRYYYKTSSTATETYKSCGIWTYSFNVSGSASYTMYFEANPYLLYTGSVYSSRLLIWCGETNSKRNWKWRLRTKTGPRTGTWGSWNTQSAEGINGFAYPSGNFLEAMKNYNGVEFYIY